jgi:hypothetical protein
MESSLMVFDNIQQRWAKLTELRALIIFSEALFQLEKRLRRWTGA